MIAFVYGQIEDTTESTVTVEAGGIGYEIFMTPADIEAALRMEGRVRIFTYLNVREDAMQLFGFLSKDDLSMFKLLLGVNGIGPKGAMGILSGLSADELRFAVLSDDIKTISKAPGIGKKSAQKLILELKDKLDFEEVFEKKLSNEADSSGVDLSTLVNGRQEAVEALTALGYSGSEALRAVKKVSGVDEEDVEAILKAALKQL